VFSSYGSVDAYGEVHLWGKIIEHQDGYRAEYAYPKKMCTKPIT